MRHFLFLLLYGGLVSSERSENYRFYTPYELDQQPTIAINDVYETSISSFDRTARLDCLQYQNQNGFASRNITDDDRLIWQETRLFKVKWFRLINSTDSVEITSSNSADTFSVDAYDHLIIQSEQLDNVKTWLYCTWEYIGHSMQSVSDSRSHDPSYRGWYDTRSPSWKNEELVDFNHYPGKFKSGRQPIIWRSVPILFKAKVLPNQPEIACYNDMHIVHDDPIKLSLDNCPRSGNELKIIYDTPFALDCLASQGHFDNDDIEWFYENEPITLSKSSYGAMLNVQTMINGHLLDMNGVHLVQGQLHFNQAKGAFDGSYHCQIGPYQKSPPIQLSIVSLQDLPPNTKERDVFDGRCFYPDAERSQFEVFIETNNDGESLKIVTLERNRNGTIGNDVVFPRLCYKIAESYRKKLNSDGLNNEREPFYIFPPLRPGIKNHTHFYESRSPAPFLSNDLLHSSVHRVTDLSTFSWEPYSWEVMYSWEVTYTRPKFRFVSNGVNYDITSPNEFITFTMEPVVFSQFRLTAEMNKFETYEADTNIGISKRRQFFESGKGKYWNRNAIYDDIEANVTVTCHIVGMGFSDSDLVWLHNGEKIDPRVYKHSVRSARKINSYSTIHDVEQSKNVYCESLEDDEKKKTCREEQLLISYIPPVMPAIPDWDTTIDMHDFKAFFDPVDRTQRFYWRMDIELTPEQARGTFQCQAGNERTGFKSATTIFFDRSDYKYTPAALSMQGQSMNDATNAQEWLSGVIGDPFTFECRIDGLYRGEIARFQWDSDQSSSHGDMSERQYHFPEPLLVKNGEEVKMNYAGLFAHRTDLGSKPSRHRIEIPWESGDGEVDDPLVPASMYNNFAFRPIVVRSPGHDQCVKDERNGE